MAAIYNCECRDGRTITGTPRWAPEELRVMEPGKLAEVLGELRDFAAYYEVNYSQPINSLEAECRTLQEHYDKAKRRVIILGILTIVFTVLWIVFALIPSIRFSWLTLTMAVLTFFSIIALIPILLFFISTQETYQKRYPRKNAKLERLRKKLDQEILGDYADLLIGGYFVSPAYSMSQNALECMIHALNSGQASTLSEASAVCKRIIGRPAVQRIITSARSVGVPAGQKHSHPENVYDKSDLGQMQTQGPDLRAVLQLSDYLHAALRSFAADQKASSDSPDSIAATLSMEEEALIAEYRTLEAEEKKRIRRTVHSFYSKRS